MLLRDWMKLTNRSSGSLADEMTQAGCRVSQSAVWKWVWGTRRPRPQAMACIERLSARAVTPNDFFGTEPAE